ncbi:MAG: gluconate 2-dehydrogenase subunit 3 family protein [Rhodothermales bacterium]|nr:gluconate 2-dehydrogenase subunit 3 family protein [Rhodothermales bacterium]
MENTRMRLDRRSAIGRIGQLIGGVVSLPLASAVLSGCNLQSTAPWQPQTLLPEQNQLVVALTELIIPETDTPGAAAANVNRFVDLILSDWYTEDEKVLFLEGLAGIDAVAVEEYGAVFLELPPSHQVAILRDMESEISEEDSEPQFFTMLKELTLVGYYTSEIGATEELRFLAVPGKYDPCVPFEEIGRTWA